MISSYITIATLLQLPECQEQKQEIIVEAVKTWLKDQSKWLLILDNADDLDVLPPFLPPVPGGHVLITTQAWDMQRLATRLEVETFTDEQGAIFLLRRAGLLTPKAKLSQASTEDRQFSTQLTQEMGGLPLALDQAGAYLEATGISLKEYLELYRTHRKELLQERRSRIHDHPDVVATTWSLSFTRVREKNPAAADLLCFCAFLAPDAIPEEILIVDGLVLGPLLARLASDTFQRNQAIEALRAHSLVRRDSREKMLSVHRLVQAVLQDHLSEAERRTWAERAILAINSVFPDVKPSTWARCERLLPQALQAAQLVEDFQIIRSEAGSLLCKSAFYLKDRARYQEAELLYQQALRVQNQALGPEHLDAALSLNGLAILYEALGRYAEAEPLYQRALHIREQQLGPEHDRVATQLNNLATLHLKKGKYAEAEPLLQRALHIWERQLGPEHSHIASALYNLGNLYREQGKYVEAEPLYQRALDIKEKQLGPKHLDVASPLNGLAILYDGLGKYEKAELLYQRALDIWEQQLGPEHPQAVYPLNGLAILYYNQGKYAEAEPLFQRVLDIWEQQLLTSMEKSKA